MTSFQGLKARSPPSCYLTRSSHRGKQAQGQSVLFRVEPVEWATWAQVQHEWPLGPKGAGLFSLTRGGEVGEGEGLGGEVRSGLERQDGNG